MHNGTTITEILKSVHGAKTVDDLVSEVLRKLKFCTFCGEHFTRSSTLRDHIRDGHSDKIMSTAKRRVETHAVTEEATEIYICPHCHFAVGNNTYLSTFSSIQSHIQDLHRAISGPTKISFTKSRDKELIQKYIEGTAEIELFHCLFCNEAYGVSETFLEHLRFKHSDASDENIERIRVCAERFLEENKRIEIPMPNERFEKELEREDLESPLPPTPPTEVSTGTEFSKTAQSDEIEKGILSLPTRLKSVLDFTEQVNVQFYHDYEAILPYDKFNGYIFGLSKWYLMNAIEQGDKILFRLLALDKPEIQIWTEWEKHLNYIFKCPPEDFEWQSLPIHDCLLRVFNELKRSAHYSELYAHISKHRDLAIGSVEGILSKYRDILFEHTSDGKWNRLQMPKHVKLPSGRQRVQPPPFEGIATEEDIWNIVQEIEEKDIVYKLLDRTRESMSFDQICQRIAKHYKINWHTLRDKGFVNANDERLKRLSNGDFALAKWFDDSRKPVPPIKESEINLGEKEQLPKETEEVQSGFFKLLWISCKRIVEFFYMSKDKGTKN